VRVEDMTKRYWQRRFEGARRVDLAQSRQPRSDTITP
jgi:hypothetical protein